jgi:hypothetical protein
MVARLLRQTEGGKLTSALLNAKINLKRDIEASVDQDDSFVRMNATSPCSSCSASRARLTSLVNGLEG